MNYEGKSARRIDMSEYPATGLQAPPAGCAKLAPDGVLIAALVRMQELSQRVADARYMLGQTVNRVFGPTPEACSTDNCKGTPEAGGLGDALHMSLNTANHSLDIIDADLRRLLNSVGG